MGKPNMKSRDKNGRFIKTRIEHKCETCEQITLRRFCSHRCYAKSLVGISQSPDTIAKRILQLKNRKHSKKELENLKLGAKFRFKNGHKLGVGHKVSEATKEKLRNFPWPRGKNHPNWQGGKSSENRLARTRKVYKHWQQGVFERDNWTCQMCFQRGGDLEAHHIKSFAEYKELRYELSNGITLCPICHSITDKHRYAKDFRNYSYL